MNNENDSNNFDTAAVWRAAEHRRAEDLAGWLGALPFKRKAKEEESAVVTGPAHQPQPI